MHWMTEAQQRNLTAAEARRYIDTPPPWLEAVEEALKEAREEGEAEGYLAGWAAAEEAIMAALDSA